MTRAVRRVTKREMACNYSNESPPVDEFDAEAVTQPIPPCTMAQLVATAVRP